MNKKLQVFVSSTYTDLIEERQAAVQAILDAGHIPAGMELFKAGNESQLKTIYKWIDESDVYMLILGGRYGTVESKSGKSYTQLEYEYALNKGIPVFAVVLSKNFLTSKINSLGLEKTMEQDYPDKHKSFKSIVMSKIIREVDDCKDIKIAIHTTLNEFLNQYDLTGWIRNNSENDTSQLLKENNSLLKENNSLNKQIQKLREQINEKANEQFGNYSFVQLVNIFKAKRLTIPKKFFESENDITLNALDFFINTYNDFGTGIDNLYGTNKLHIYFFYHICPYFVGFDVLEKVKISGSRAQRFQITAIGAKFYAMLEYKKMINS